MFWFGWFGNSSRWRPLGNRVCKTRFISPSETSKMFYYTHVQLQNPTTTTTLHYPLSHILLTLPNSSSEPITTKIESPGPSDRSSMSQLSSSTCTQMTFLTPQKPWTWLTRPLPSGFVLWSSLVMNIVVASSTRPRVFWNLWLVIVCIC